MTPKRPRFQVWPFAAFSSAVVLALVTASVGFAQDETAPGQQAQPPADESLGILDCARGGVSADLVRDSIHRDGTRHLARDAEGQAQTPGRPGEKRPLDRRRKGLSRATDQVGDGTTDLENDDRSEADNVRGASSRDQGGHEGRRSDPARDDDQAQRDGLARCDPDVRSTSNDSMEHVASPRARRTRRKGRATTRGLVRYPRRFKPRPQPGSPPALHRENAKARSERLIVITPTPIELEAGELRIRAPGSP